MVDSTYIGVLLAVGGGIIQSFGFIAQKRGHNLANKANESLSAEEQKSVLFQWIWWVGITTYTVGGALNSIALNYAAQSIIAPIGAVNLATIAILSHFILKEKLTLKDVIAIFIIIIGLCFVVIYGPTTDTSDITINELREYYSEMAYIIVVILLTLITIIIFVIVKYYERLNFNNPETNNEIIFGNRQLLFGYVWIGCYFASNNVLFIKSVVTILLSTDLNESLTDYLTYIIVILWILCLLLMEYHRQKALSHFGALYVVPIFSVLSIVLTALIGMIYFKEFKTFTIVTAILFTLGILITLIGVLVLSYDVGKILTELYDDTIKVAFIKYDEISDFKYPKMIVTGGPMTEFFDGYFLKRTPICDNSKKSKNANNLVQAQNDSELQAV